METGLTRPLTNRRPQHPPAVVSCGRCSGVVVVVCGSSFLPSFDSPNGGVDAE